jgi:hypothetical protein
MLVKNSHTLRREKLYPGRVEVPLLRLAVIERTSL